MQMRLTDRQKREAAAYQFELQASKLFLSVGRRMTNYRYLVRDEMTNEQHTAMVLACTWDFYEYRLNRGRTRVDLLIVGRHNAVSPLPVISLEESREYPPGAPPDLARPGARRPNHEETMLLVSKLILGVEEVERQLDGLPRRTRQRYLQRARHYLGPRVGRPWAS